MRLGLTPDLKPKFLKHYADLFDAGRDAMVRYVEEDRATADDELAHAWGMQ